MRIACHAITWGAENFEQAVKEIGQLGFKGFETFASVVDEFGGDRLAEFQAKLQEHQLQLIALYGGGAMHDPAQFETVVEHNVRIAHFLQANGADRLVLGPGRRPPSGPSQDDLLNLIHCANEIGRRTLALGVQACLHPHVHTIVERIAEIDLVLNQVDPRYVALAADTAHFAKGNANVPQAEVTLFERYAERIKYVHLKDWDPTLPAESSGEGGTAIIRDFVELGAGRVDLRACLEILQSRQYAGWVTIELDYTRRTPYESVAMSKVYLERELGLTV